MTSYRQVNLSDVVLKGVIGVGIAGGGVLPLAPSLANAASVRKEIIVDASPDFVWDALRDFGAVHTRLARGFVVDTKMEGDARVVFFANGTQAKELLVDIDDELMRLVYSAVNPRLVAHSASAQLYREADDKTRFVWVADFLPNELKPYIDGQMEAGAEAIKRTLEEEARSHDPSPAVGVADEE